MMSRIFLMATAATLLLAPAAHAGERYPGESRQERPTYTPSWDRTQRDYLPSYQRELERRRICGSYCDDLTRRRPPFER